MKYRLKVTTLKDGEKHYMPQVKTWWLGWRNLLKERYQLQITDNENAWAILTVISREDALRRINAHSRHNEKENKVEYEYIHDNF